MPTIPSLTQAFSALGSWMQNPSFKTQTSTLATATPIPGLPSSPYPVGGAPAVPRVGGPTASPAANTSISAAGTDVGGRSIMGPQGPGAYVPYPSGTGGAYTPYKSPENPTGGGGMSIAPPATPQQPNATDVRTKQPIYVPPPVFKPAVPTPSGASADPNTGAVTRATSFAEAPAAPLAISSNTGNVGSLSSYSSSAGGSPAVPSMGGAGLSRSAVYDEYLKSLKPSDEEEEAQKGLDELAAAEAKGLVDTQNQPIALPFITGQMANIERSKALKAMPLEARLARLQARRTMAQTASKAALDREDKLAEEGKPVSVAPGNVLVDPKTGRQIFSSPNSKAPQTIETEKGVMQWNEGTGTWESTGFAGTKAADKAAAAQASAQAAQALGSLLLGADGASGTIGQAIGMVGPTTSGLIGATTQNVPNTPSYNLARTIDTIKANLGFQALSQMRAQSPTGGALGQVTERELAFLQATVASLDQGQSPEQLKANLEAVRTHFANWQNAVMQAAQQGQAGGGDTGAGGLYDF